MPIGRFGLLFALLAATPLMFSAKLAWWSTHPDGPKVGIRVRLSPLPPAHTCDRGTELCITLNGKKELCLNGWPITTRDLRKQVAARPHVRIYLAVDPSLPYADAIVVMDVVQSVQGKIILPSKNAGRAP